MDAVRFLEERKRMFKNGKPVPDLDVDITYNSEKVVKIVEEWSAAHPKKTHQDVFLKQYPNAQLDCCGIVEICPCDIDTTIHQNCSADKCGGCRRNFWMQEVE